MPQTCRGHTTNILKRLGMVYSRLFAKNCMDEDVKDACLKTLDAAKGVLVFDPDRKAIVAMDRVAGQEFFARGGD